MNLIRKACAPENFRQGRQGFQITAIVVHLIDGSQAGCDATFASSSLTLRRSAHYSVGKAGEVHQYVDEADTAYHAGRILQPTWPGMKKKADGAFLNPNLHTIGVEHEGRADDEWTDQMYDASAELLAGIASRHTLGALAHGTNVAMHREIFAAKSCPGNKVNLDLLIRKANGIAPPVPAPPAPGGIALTILHNVNVRLGTASVTAPIKELLKAGAQVSAARSLQGDAVNGIDKWYELAAGEFIWAGATDRP